MTRAACIVGVAATVFSLGTRCLAENQARGGTPRPAEKPPEYGCVFLDLNTDPSAVWNGDRIKAFLLKYRCEKKTRPVDVEVWYERWPGKQELVKIASGVVLEKGEHTLRLAGGSLAYGGRYITVLKADAPQGKIDVVRRVDNAICKGWRIAYVEYHLHLGGCDIDLHTVPDVFKTGEKIDKFVLATNCKYMHKGRDIKISWKPLGSGNPEIVQVATDMTLLAGPHTINLMGGGRGREGYYVLEIAELTQGSSFKTNCTAWTLSNK